MRLLFASNNAHKRGEILSIMRSIGLVPDLLSPKESVPGAPEPDETGSTFEANALIKAKYYYDLTGVPTFADDSGLEIDALGGAPGVRTARFAGENATDAENRLKALAALSETGERGARFRCVICYYDGAVEEYFEGVCEGKISTEELGAGGFGYDPIFIPEGYDKTFAQLPPDVKDRISHRARAVNLLANMLKTLHIR